VLHFTCKNADLICPAASILLALTALQTLFHWNGLKMPSKPFNTLSHSILNNPLMLEQRLQTLFQASIDAKRQSLAQCATPILAAAQQLAQCISQGGKILICGNGGSASDAQHFAAELVGRFERERAALPALALTTDSSILTAIANDYGYDAVFARQVAGLGRPGDVLLALSTSGNSANVCEAISRAQSNGLSCIALTGRDGGRIAGLLAPEAIEIRVPHDNTARIQEVHSLTLHCLCDLLDQLLMEKT
jgi:D-sedoheptulose 7-phosphate isomerase